MGRSGRSPFLVGTAAALLATLVTLGLGELLIRVVTRT